ncbi:MAG: WXG100 family type VII secretion target [Lachnospiraceae bacterium]|nr:WXG100 family type VII secretion target [Lachnospiraceae bacterium]
MANVITVTTGQIEAKAGELKKLNADFKKRIEELVTEEKALNAMWDGEANDAFHQSFNNDIIQMNNFYNAIEQYVAKLNEIATTYNNAEAKNLSTASTRKYK